MVIESKTAIAPRWIRRKESSGEELTLAGEWTLFSGLGGIPEAAAAELELSAGQILRIDTSGVTRWDSTLPAFLLALAELCRNRNCSLDAGRLPQGLRTVLKMADELSPPTSSHVQRPAQLIWRIGQGAVRWHTQVLEGIALLGDVAIALGRLARGNARFDKPGAWALLQGCGADAIPIVGLVNLLVGAIIAFVGSLQLTRFGAGYLLADGVAVATVREMAAVITAIVLSGRTGAAFAAQISTMEGNEEIDSLRVMGVPVVEFVVLPRVLTLVLMAPLLYLYACAFGIFGGLLVGTGMLGQTFAYYTGRTIAALTANQFALGASKSLAFGALVALAGCYYGLRAGRSAAAVGEATTSAVVAGIVGVIATDAVFAVCAHALSI